MIISDMTISPITMIQSRPPVGRFNATPMTEYSADSHALSASAIAIKTNLAWDMDFFWVVIILLLTMGSCMASDLVLLFGEWSR